MKTEKIHSQYLQKEDFCNWFIEDFYIFNFESIELVVEKTLFTFSDGTSSDSILAYIKIIGQFGCSLFLNRTGYLSIHYIDFEKKQITGFVHNQNFKSVLKPETYEKLNLKIEQYGK